MIPSLCDGDLVFFRKYYVNKSDLKIGDIIIFNHPSKKIRLIKRIKAIKQFSIEVSGDNQLYSTDSKSFGAIQKEKVIGIVTSKISIKFISNINNLFNP
tara:strand:- start:1046 stop:1342 length:297 start_codon:yes stop_codon:yes gene_type:complete